MVAHSNALIFWALQEKTVAMFPLFFSRWFICFCGGKVEGFLENVYNMMVGLRFRDSFFSPWRCLICWAHLKPPDHTGSSDAQLAPLVAFHADFQLMDLFFEDHPWRDLGLIGLISPGRSFQNVSRRTWALIPRKPTTGFKIEILLTGGWFTCVVPTRFVWWSSPKSIKESHDIYIQLYLNTLYVLSIWCILYTYIYIYYL